MKKLKLVFLSLSTIYVLSSCIETRVEPGGNVADEKVFDMDDFNAISLGSAFNVEVIPSSEFRVTANGAQRDIKDLYVRVINKTLKVSYQKGDWFGNLTRARMDLVIEVPYIEAVDISGAAKMKISKFDNMETLAADLSGASKLWLRNGMNKLEADLSGASVLELNAHCPAINAELSGASKLDAYDGESEEVLLTLSGASKAYVSVSEYLRIDASGASSLYYKGTPRIDQEVSGGSKVKQEK